MSEAAVNENIDEPKPRRIRILGREFTMPQSRPARIAIGVVLVIFGCLGFLPILGFWMIPLGILVLSYEFASVRRMRRRTAVRWGRWRKTPSADATGKADNQPR